MNEVMFLMVSGLLAVVVLPPMVVGFNEKRLRRRHRALACRRKQKLRL